MVATDYDTAIRTPENCHEKLKKDLVRLLDNVDNDLERHAVGEYSATYETLYKTTLRCGLESLIGTISIDSQAWDDAMAYARDVILSPQDTERRASSPWIRSCSELHKEFMNHFGPGTISAARLGTDSIIEGHYRGDRTAIAHVNKKASYLRHCHEVKVGAMFYPQPNPLSAGCYQVVILPVSLALSYFLPIEKVVQLAHLSNLSACDDYGSFTHADYDVRLRLSALAAGVAYQYRRQAINFLLDGSALQARGAETNDPFSIEAAMAWRAVSGCATVCSRYNFEECDLKDNLVGPLVMMATHDLFDWRSDTAAGNHENGVSAVYGFGVEAPFHRFLEALLEKALQSPQAGLYGLASIVYMHFTCSRYGAYEYRGDFGPACKECIDILQSATTGAGLEWTPKPPPRSYAEGDKLRDWGRLWSDEFIDCGIIQEALGWFQYLISSGQIWVFDLLAGEIDPVDNSTDWA